MKELFKGTKGEWVNGWNKGLTGPTTPSSRNPTVDENREFIPISNGMETVAIIIQQENNSMNELEANAKLIASAPELLKALLEVKEILEKAWPEKEWDDFANKETSFTKAINKALK